MEYRQFSGKTVEDAITEATIALGVTSDQIDYEVISEGSAGLLGIFSRNAVIKVWTKAEAEAEAKAEAELRAKAEEEELKAQARAKAQAQGIDVKAQPRQAKPQGKPKSAEPKAAREDVKAVKTEVKSSTAHVVENDPTGAFITEVLEKMGMPSTVSVEVDDVEKSVNINIEGEDTGDIIGKKGQTLDALQYLASIIANKDRKDYYRVKLDTKNYRERRQKTLENMAKNVASKVKKTRHKVVLEPMNPYERRIIHAYLQGDESITTKSEGEEPNRRVVVYYKK